MDAYTYEDFYTGAFTEDTTLYGVYKPVTDPVEISIEPLKCGTKIKTERGEGEYITRVQNVSVTFILPQDAPYAVSEGDDILWMEYATPPFDLYGDAEPYLKAFSGTVKGGETYYTRVYLEMAVNENGSVDTVFGPAEEIVLAGDIAADSKVNYGYSYPDDSYVYLTLGVTAVHDWGDITYTWTDDNTTVTAARTCRCAECGFTETETAAASASENPGGGTEYTATFKNPAFATQTKTVGGETVFLPGDVDNNGVINSADARLCLHRAVDLETYKKGSREFSACDVDRSGDVTSADARKILRAAVELEDPKNW